MGLRAVPQGNLWLKRPILKLKAVNLMRISIRFIAGLGLLFLQVVLWGQSVSDITGNNLSKDKTRQGVFNAGTSPDAILVAGGAFYVSSPSPTYKVEPEKAYVNPAFTECRAALRKGGYIDIMARIRRTDQKIEFNYEGEIYELKSTHIERLESLEDNRSWLLLFDPLRKDKGIGLYEELYTDGDSRLLLLETAEWQDPPKQNMFDTRDVHRTLEIKKKIIYIAGDSTSEVKSMKRLLSCLPERWQRTANNLRKVHKLKNNKEDYVYLLSQLAAL